MARILEVVVVVGEIEQVKAYMLVPEARQHGVTAGGLRAAATVRPDHPPVAAVEQDAHACNPSAGAPRYRSGRTAYNRPSSDPRYVTPFGALTG